MNATEDKRTWVFDTSSIIEVRSLHNVGPKWAAILQQLTPLVDDDRLFFPREVLGEIASFRPRKGEADPIRAWAEEMESKACRESTNFKAVKRVLERCEGLVDPNKTSGPEQADPWVVALALHLMAYSGSMDVTVVTEDRSDKPNKMSLATACGLWSIPTVPLAACLGRLGIWKAKL